MFCPCSLIGQHVKIPNSDWPKVMLHWCWLVNIRLIAASDWLLMLRSCLVWGHRCYECNEHVEPPRCQVRYCINDTHQVTTAVDNTTPGLNQECQDSRIAKLAMIQYFPLDKWVNKTVSSSFYIDPPLKITQPPEVMNILYTFVHVCLGKYFFAF